MVPAFTFTDITPEILILIAEIDEFKGAWRALGQLAPAQLTSLNILQAR